MYNSCLPKLEKAFSCRYFQSYISQVTIHAQMNIFFCLADWAGRPVLKMCEILLKYPTFEGVSFIILT